jgi:hypothetical protein
MQPHLQVLLVNLQVASALLRSLVDLGNLASDAIHLTDNPLPLLTASESANVRA